MHKIHAKPFSLDDFSHDHLTEEGLEALQKMIEALECFRVRYLEKKEKADWYNMIQLLPTSYNQLRTCTLNYENLVNMYFARKSHKLQEWHSFCDWIRSLPYANVLILGEDPA